MQAERFSQKVARVSNPLTEVELNPQIAPGMHQVSFLPTYTVPPLAINCYVLNACSTVVCSMHVQLSSI